MPVPRAQVRAGAVAVVAILAMPIALAMAWRAVPAMAWSGTSSASENQGGTTGGGFATVGGASANGAGQLVVVIDGAFNPTHPMLAGQVAEEACFGSYSPTYRYADTTCSANSAPWSQDRTIRFESGPGTSRYDTACRDSTGLVCNMFHGTGVAALAAGKKVDAGSIVGTVSGIAPGAKLALLKVGTQDGWGYEKTVVAALQYVRDVLSTRYSVAAVNVSYDGGTAKISDSGAGCPATGFGTVVSDLTAKRIPVVVAAGNDGWASATGPWSCLPDVVSVGSANVTDPNTLTTGAYATNASTRIKLLAPVGSPASTADANGVWTAFPAMDVSTGALYENNYNKMVGTSFAAPQAAGALAVLKQRFPAKSVAELTAILQRDGVNVIDARPGTANVVMPRMWLAGAAADRDTRPAWDYTGDNRTDLPVVAADGKTLMVFPVQDNGAVDTSRPTTISAAWTGHAITVPTSDYRTAGTSGFIATVASGSTVNLAYYEYNPAAKTLAAPIMIASNVGSDIKGAAYLHNLPIVGTGEGIILQRSSGALELRLRVDNSPSLAAPANLLPAGAGVNSKLVGVADLNGDGKPDLVVRDATSGVPRAYLGVGAVPGTSGAPFSSTATVLSAATWWADKRQVAVVDGWASAADPAPWLSFSAPTTGNLMVIPLTASGTSNEAALAMSHTWAGGARFLVAARAD
ncbi:MAG: S8 family serine peptidase [Frankiaceae bacterium]|jgi:serine protease|nr:S8 family serine peptidase [Frankiaceae bacterium]